MSDERWSDEFMDARRRIKDLEADDAMAAILAGAEDPRPIADKLFRDLTEGEEPRLDRLPEAARAWFEQPNLLPDWADSTAVARGENLFNTYGPTLITVLLCSSLPQCYAGADGAQVLHRTGRMVGKLQRRIIETAQFVLDVMSPGGLTPAGRGVRAARKIRLVHASIRSFVKQTAGWDSAFGEPINQEDLLGTLLAFSFVTADGAPRLGVTLRPKEAEAYLHCWNVIGHVMGIERDLLPKDVDDARAAWAAIARRQFRESVAGRELTAALLDFLHDLIPGERFDGVADVLMRDLCGARVADMLGVPDRNAERILLRPLQHLGVIASAVTHAIPAMHAVAPHFNRQLLLGLESAWRAGEKPPFRVPAAMRGKWKLTLPGAQPGATSPSPPVG